MKLAFHIDTTLDDDITATWRVFVAGLDDPHYTHDPAWASVLVDSHVARPRTPVFTWVTSDGELSLAATGVRQHSPRPGLAYYDFGRGPAFRDVSVFRTWIHWLRSQLAHDAVYIRMAPYRRLADGGDEVEAILMDEGFARDVQTGTWATLMVDLQRTPEELRASFQRQTRQNLGRCHRIGLHAAERDEPTGWEAFCSLYAGLSRRVGLLPLHVQDLRSLHEHWFAGGPGGTVLIGTLEDRPIVGAIVLLHGPRAYYLTSAAVRNSKGLAPGFCLPWDAMLYAQRHECLLLDLCGYSLTAGAGDPLHGVNRFKRGFVPGVTPVEYCAAHDLIERPRTYATISALRRAKDRMHHYLQTPHPDAD